MALGMVMQLPDAENEHSINRQQLQAKLDVAMGGVCPSCISHASSLPGSCAGHVSQVIIIATSFGVFSCQYVAMSLVQ